MHSDAASQGSGWWQGCGAAYAAAREDAADDRQPAGEREHHDEVRARAVPHVGVAALAEERRGAEVEGRLDGSALNLRRAVGRAARA